MHIRRSLLLVALFIGLSATAATFAQTAPAGEEIPALEPAPPDETGDQPAAAPQQPLSERQQPPGEEQANEERRQPTSPFGGWTLPLLLIGVFVLMYVFMGRSRRKQESQRREMLANLKKGDKVTTIGGIVGTVTDVREDEVTVKIDESNNTRVRLARWSVRGVGDEAKQEKPDQRK